MKITRNTPDQLIITDTPWLIGSMLIVFILAFVSAGLLVMTEEFWIGLLFASFGGLLGFGAFVAFVRKVQVIFDRQSDSIIFRTRSLFGFSEMRHNLSDLSRADLETSIGSKGIVYYRPTLVLDKGMSKGSMPILDAYTNGSGPHHMVAAINTWLEVSPS